MRIRNIGAVAIALATLFVSSVMASPATAADAVDVHIDSVSTQWLTSNRGFAVTLGIHSTSAHDVVEVTTSYSPSPLVGRSQVIDAIKNRALPRMTSIGTQTFNNVDAGDQTLTVNIARNQFSLKKRGAYIFHFDVKIDGETKPLNVVMPYVSFSSFSRPVQVVTLWTVASEPTINTDGTPIDESASQQFGEANALNAIVSAGNSKVTWLTDPDILTTANALGADAWKGILSNNSTSAEKFTLPFANADIATLLEANLQQAVSTATRPVQDAPLMYVPRTGDIKASTWKTLASRSATLVVSDRCYPSSNSTFTTNGIYKNSSVNQTALVSDSQMSDLMTVAISNHRDAVAYQQALFSDSLIMQLERPNTQRILVLNPRTANVHVDVANAEATLRLLNSPWMLPTSVASALTHYSGARVHSGCATRYAAKSTLAHVLDSNRARRKLQALIAGTSEEDTLVASMLRSMSMNLHKTRLHALTKDLVSYTDELRHSVEVLSAGAVILPAEQGKVPITIHNSLSVPVHIYVSASGEPAVRVIPESLVNVEIGAGKRKSIEVPVRLIGSDVGFINLQLKDSSGRAIGSPVRIQLSSSAYATVARFVMGIAGILLVLLLVRRGYWRIRRLFAPAGKNADHE
jgi:hypothetical protein